MKVICFFFDRNVGGPHVRGKAVYTRLAERGVDARIAIPAGPGTAEAYLTQAGLTVDRLAIRKPVSPRKLGQFFLYLLALPLSLARVAAYLRRQRPDVVHVNSAMDMVPALAARLAGVPSVWYLTDTILPPGPSRLIGRMVHAVASYPVAVAGAVARHYGLTGSRAADVIYEPVDVDLFAPRDPGRPPGRPVVLGLLANWNPLKGQDRFIAVIERLRAQGYDVRGRVIGSFLDSQRGYWEPLLARIEEKGLRDAIDMPGFAEDVPAAIAQIDIMTLTSRSEACPLCVLETMAGGVPLVCFRVGGVEELLGVGTAQPAGIAVEEGDVDAMVAAVARMIDTPDSFGDYAEAGRRRAREKFSLDICVENHLRAYRKAIAANKAA